MWCLLNKLLGILNGDYYKFCKAKKLSCISLMAQVKAERLAIEYGWEL